MNSLRTGQLASELLENPLLKETLELIESTIIDSWRHSKVSSEREELWYTLNGAQRFRTVLESAIQNAMVDRAIMERDSE